MFDRLIAFQARQKPQAVAVASLQGAVTFARFDADIDRFAAALAELVPGRPRLAGVRIEDPYVHWIVTLALAHRGIATTSAGLLGDRVLPLLAPDVLVSDRDERPGEAATIVSLPPARGAEILKSQAVPRGRIAVDPNGTARVGASSGTTGTPKAFRLTWRQIEERIYRGAFQAGTAASFRRLLCTLDLDIGGFLPNLLAWCAGGTVLFGPRNAAMLAGSLSQLAPTSLIATPIQLGAIVDALPKGSRPMPDLMVGVSGSHTPRAMRDAVRLRLTPNVQVYYGTTEANVISEAPASAIDHDESAVGWALPWVEVEVVGPDGAVLPHGEAGRIRLRGPDVIDGYLGEVAGASERFRDGWFYPGDIGTIAPDGLIRLEGREDEVLNIGGAKFMPHLLEGAAASCPGVIEAGAFAMQDATGLPAPWIAVVRDDSVTGAALSRAVREAVPDLPKLYFVWTDRIPRTASGKVQRDRLRELVQMMLLEKLGGGTKREDLPVHQG